LPIVVPKKLIILCQLKVAKSFIKNFYVVSFPLAVLNDFMGSHLRSASAQVSLAMIPPTGASVIRSKQHCPCLLFAHLKLRQLTCTCSLIIHLLSFFI
jgi:hypothetical protein